MSTEPTGQLDPRPSFPDDRGGVAILGCGTIAQSAHLPAYQQYDVDVVGVWSRDPRTTAEVTRRFPFVGRVYATVDELLADRDVRIVDIATPTRGRVHWVDAAVRAGKHVLSQKPLTDDPGELETLSGVLQRAREAGIRVAANQNGRWAPAWRVATQLIRSRAIGDIVGVTHMHDKPLPPLAGTLFDDLDHMLVTDYLNHWIDITRCWLEPASITSVQASDSRVPGEPETARNPWSASVSMIADNGATALIRVVGDVVTRSPSCPFWIHGTNGTIRGSVLLGSDRLSLDRNGSMVEYALPGAWFVDGFAGTMAELMTAIVEDREPENSAVHAVNTARLTMAARESAEHAGAPVEVALPGTDRADP